MKAPHNAKRVFLSILLSILSLVVLHCAVPPGPVFQKDGKLYGKTEGQWGGRWWNYYQRGLSYAQGEYWEHAIRDLQEAITRRFEDQRRARTYGLHILDDYFPHRELGIVYYQQGRFNEAIAELEASISQFESAKAKYFLNEARRSLLQETGADVSSPRLYIAFPKTGYLTRLSSLTISAEAMDDQFVESISVNDQEIPVELSSSTITFHADIQLKRGENKIVAQVTDLVGRKGTEEIMVWCDQEAPVIYIDRIMGDDLGRGYTIDGYIADMSGVAGFWINGIRVDCAETRGSEFSVYLHAADMKPQLTFQALDGLGNSTSGEIMIAEVFGIGADRGSPLPRLAYCGNDLGGMIATLAEGESASAETGPAIRLKDLPERITVDWEECFLEGEARDQAGITGVSVNGIPLVTRTAKVVFFNFLVPLDVGENVITVQAESESGQVRTTTVHVERTLNCVQKIGARLNMAIFPFKYLGERDEIRDLLYNALIQGFVEQRRFQVVDRERIDGLLARITEEKDDPSCVEMGRLVTAEGVIAGSAYFYDGYLEIIARAVDTETTVILDAEEVFGPISSLKDVQLLAQGLSLKFKQAFPLAEGGVVNILSDAVQIDLGNKDRLLPYMKIIFFREDQPVKLPGSERIAERRFTILGEGRIKKVYESTADAVLASQKDIPRVEVDDRVITK
ncbi:MAG: hypothetical protein ACMUIS_00585 [bacterium]